MRHQLSRNLHMTGQFVRLNVRDLRSLDGPTLRRKFRTLFSFHLRNQGFAIALLPLTLLLALALRVIRPLVVVRLGSINAARIGHLSMDPEMSAAEKEIGIWLPRRPVFDIWYAWRGSYPVCNQQLLTMWRRSFRIWPAWLWQRVDAVSRLMPGGAAHLIPYRKGISGVPDHLQADAFGALRRTRPHIAFTDAEAREARRQIEDAGLDPAARHVCVLVRDQTYLRSRVPGDHSAHDFRDSDISKFLPAMRWLAEQDVVVYRMGSVVGEPLPFSHARIVDYATNGMRTELLDIWLSANCEFFVSTGTGIDGVASAFRRTRVFADLGQLASLALTLDTLSIPKLLRYESDGRLLTLRESVDIGALSFVDTSQFTGSGLGLRGNTPEEIAAVVREAFERRTGKWLPRPDEEELQERMLDALPELMKTGGVCGRVGYEFLRENEWWLE